ncbi:slc47a1 [Symbiodinium sp. CCMP2456]|nr:slc47a1 [Symbiodinium sp. CCMP2456]
MRMGTPSGPKASASSFPPASPAPAKPKSSFPPVDCAALDFGIMPPASRLDDPSALADFLSSISAPDTLAAAVKSAGFHTLGSLAFALTDPSDPDEVMKFIRVILKIPDGDATATFRPDVSCLRRTILEACSIAPPRAASANAPSQLPPAAPSASTSNKITAAEFLSLRKDYLKKYPGELLTPANTPSVEFLSLIRQHHESGQSVWIPGVNAPLKPIFCVGRNPAAPDLIAKCFVPFWTCRMKLLGRPLVLASPAPPSPFSGAVWTFSPQPWPCWTWFT